MAMLGEGPNVLNSLCAATLKASRVNHWNRDKFDRAGRRIERRPNERIADELGSSCRHLNYGPVVAADPNVVDGVFGIWARFVAIAVFVSPGQCEVENDTDFIGCGRHHHRDGFRTAADTGLRGALVCDWLAERHRTLLLQLD